MMDEEGLMAGEHKEVRAGGPGRQTKRAADVGTVRAFPDLTGTSEESCWSDVQQIYEYAKQECQGAIDWYWVKRGPKKRQAVGVRLLVIVLLSLGTLAPLLAAGGLSEVRGVQIIWLGYVSLAAAGTCLGLDKLLGFSADWMRYIAAALALQRVLDRFLFKWAIAVTPLTSGCPDAKKRAELLSFIRDFVQQVRAEVEKETTEWATQYRRSLAEMERAVSDRMKQPESKPPQGQV
jgi:hypothetical protein